MGTKRTGVLLLAAFVMVTGCATMRDIVTSFPTYQLEDLQNGEVSREVQRFDEYMQKLNSLRNRQIMKYNSLSKATSFWNLSNGVVTLGAVSAGQAASALNLDSRIGAVTGVTIALGGLSIFVMELSGIKGQLSDAREGYLSTNVMIQEADLHFRTLTDSLQDPDPKTFQTALRELKNLNAKLQQFITLGPV